MSVQPSFRFINTIQKSETCSSQRSNSSPDLKEIHVFRCLASVKRKMLAFKMSNALWKRNLSHLFLLSNNVHNNISLNSIYPFLRCSCSLVALYLLLRSCAPVFVLNCSCQPCSSCVPIRSLQPIVSCPGVCLISSICIEFSGKNDKFVSRGFEQQALSSWVFFEGLCQWSSTSIEVLAPKKHEGNDFNYSNNRLRFLVCFVFTAIYFCFRCEYRTFEDVAFYIFLLCSFLHIFHCLHFKLRQFQ